MMSTGASLTGQLDELQLLQCSLLPGESFAFALPEDDAREWSDLLRDHVDSELSGPQLSQQPASACRLEVRVKDLPLWFEVELPRDYPEHDVPLVYVRGDEIDRTQQEKWQKIVRDNMAELQQEQSGFLVQNLLCMSLLPLLHQNASSFLRPIDTPPAPETTEQERIYHALFTSHHLISTAKRRNLQKWVSELSLCGFAKVGYPGCIYAEGARTGVEDFVSRVKAMQWLALRVRFVEPLDMGRFGRLPERREDPKEGVPRWVELEKVGEVVEYMRRIGREEFVTEMGLGSSTSTSSS
ncbi:hypothetical protein M0805_005898 [Coniferiporia weirii]|nr:hypothetical protein M0805_005898 [Coniferiporia weirii]